MCTDRIRKGKYKIQICIYEWWCEHFLAIPQNTKFKIQIFMTNGQYAKGNTKYKYACMNGGRTFLGDQSEEGSPASQ